MLDHPVENSIYREAKSLVIRRLLIFIGLLAILVPTGWYVVQHYFSIEEDAEITANYDDLDPNSFDYWRKRTERDIDSARAFGKNPENTTVLMDRNLSATIRDASRLRDPLVKTLALASIVRAQISRNVGSHIDTAMSLMERSQESKNVRNGLLPALVWFRIQEKNRSVALNLIRQFIDNMSDRPYDPDEPEDRRELDEILNACLVLNLSSENGVILYNLYLSSQSTHNARLRDSLLSYIAEKQVENRKMDDAVETLKQIQSPERFAKALQIMIESRARVDAPRSTLHSSSLWKDNQRIAHPAFVSDAIEKAFSLIGRLEKSETQQQILHQLLESDMMVHQELRRMIRNAVVDTKVFSREIKTFALSIIDNPRSQNIRTALGMPTHETKTARENGKESNEGETDLDLYRRAVIALGLLPPTKEQIHLDDIRIMVNTAEELLKWGRRKEARSLLRQAFSKSRRMDVDRNLSFSALSIAALMVAAGDIGSAKTVLDESLQILVLASEPRVYIADFARIAEIQQRARLLDETLLTLRKMPSAPMKTEMLQKLILENLRAGRYEQALDSTHSLPQGALRTQNEQRIESLISRMEKKAKDGTYYNPDLQEILISRDAQGASAQNRLFQLVVLQIREGMLVDAGETARSLSDVSLKDKALELVVQEIVNTARPYSGDEPLHFRVRKNLLDLGFQTARELSSALSRGGNMERLYSQIAWLFPEEEVQAQWKEILNQLENAPDSEAPERKSDILARLVQTQIRRSAIDSIHPVSGVWYFLNTPEQVSISDHTIENPVFRGSTQESFLHFTSRSLAENLAEENSIVSPADTEPFTEKTTSPSVNADPVPLRVRDIPSIYAEKGFNFPEVSTLLLKSGVLLQKVSEPVLRAERYALISSLFFQLHDKNSARRFYDLAAEDALSVEDKKIATSVYLFLAQARNLAGDTLEASLTFELAIQNAKLIHTDDPALNKVDRLLNRRASERIMTDIARGQAELGLLEDAMKTSLLIKEPVFEDKLFRTIGYILLYEEKFDEADSMFRKINNLKWETACLKDLNLRKLWKYSEDEE